MTRGLVLNGPGGRIWGAFPPFFSVNAAHCEPEIPEISTKHLEIHLPFYPVRPKHTPSALYGYAYPAMYGAKA